MCFTFLIQLASNSWLLCLVQVSHEQKYLPSFFTLIFKLFPSLLHVMSWPIFFKFLLNLANAIVQMIYVLCTNTPCLPLLLYSSLCSLPVHLLHYTNFSKILLVLRLMTLIPTDSNSCLWFLCFLNFHSFCTSLFHLFHSAFY